MVKWIVGIIIVVVLVGGGWAFYNHNKSHTSTTNGASANSSSQSSTSNTSSNQTAAAGTVNITNMMFTPSQITVKKGDTVTWTNNDTLTHTVTDDLSDVGGPASGNIAPGSSYSFTFTKTGSFQYHCNIHSSMHGTIVVQ